MRHESRSHHVEAAGARLHYRTWAPDDHDRPLLLFAHGYRGHSHWWDWTAPAFTDRYRVAALDFSGMGLSGWRPQYDGGRFALDLLAVLEALGSGPATVIGHSFGGASLVHACALDAEGAASRFRPPLIEHAILVDSKFRFPTRDAEPIAHKIGATRPYASYADARARYRLLPPQPHGIDGLFEHLAGHSIRATEGGWLWHADPRLPFTPSERDGPAMLRRVATRVDFLYGELSAVVDAQRAADTVACLRRVRGPVVVPEAHHHMMIDQPLAFIAALRALLARYGN